MSIPRNPTIEPGTKVRVYWNLHRDAFSVQDAKTRRVIGHVDSLRLADARFVVSEPGRQRVISSGRKNVHAFIVGSVIAEAQCPAAFAVRYDPYDLPYFHTLDRSPVRSASIVALDRTFGAVGKVRPGVMAVDPAASIACATVG